MNVDGGVGSTFNYASHVYHKIMESIDEKDTSKVKNY